MQTATKAVVSLCFFGAGFAKLSNVGDFAVVLRSFALLSDELAGAMSYFLPWLETIAAISLWLSRYERGAEIVLFALSVVFFWAVASVWLRGLDVSCGCFGRFMTDVPLWFSLLRVGLLLMACGWLVFRTRLCAGPTLRDSHFPPVVKDNVSDSHG